MIPLIGSIRLMWFAMLHDENAARRWVRGIVGALAVSGTIYADQLEPVAHWLSVTVRCLSILCAVAVAVHGDPVAQP